MVVQSSANLAIFRILFSNLARISAAYGLIGLSICETWELVHCYVLEPQTSGISGKPIIYQVSQARGPFAKASVQFFCKQKQEASKSQNINLAWLHHATYIPRSCICGDWNLMMFTFAFVLAFYDVVEWMIHHSVDLSSLWSSGPHYFGNATTKEHKRSNHTIY